jgi:hypothetical protein
MVQTTENTPINKVVAILLALIVGPWAWLYTYTKDNWKFYTSIIIGFVILAIGVSTDYGFLESVGMIFVLAVWLFSFIMAVTRTEKWYQSFNK